MLMYSPIFGLREVSNYPRNLYQGMYARGMNPNAEWSTTVLRKNNFGRNMVIEWVRVKPDKLPAKLKTEALLLGIQL